MDADILTCPYNRQHRVASHRMPYHIVKCKRSYVGPPLEMCPFNAMHLVPSAEMAEHRANCPNFHAVMRETYDQLHPGHSQYAKIV